MPSFAKVLGFASLLAFTQAITITSPTKDSNWDVSKSFEITWTTVSTDPTVADLYLVHMASNPPLEDRLAAGIKLSDGSFTVSGVQFPTGEAYQINFVAVDTTSQILAQSNQFSISGSAPSATTTLAGYTGAPSTSSSTSSTSQADTSSTALSSSSSLTSSASLASASGAATTLSTISSNGSATSTATSGVNSTARTSTGPSASRTSANVSANGAMATTVPLAGLVFGAVAALL